MEVRTERCDKWVRAYLGDVLVVDSRDPVLFWEEVFPVPGYAFPWTDITPGLLRESSGEPPSEPFFFLPKGPVERWFDLVVPGHTRPHAAWVRAVPELSELVDTSSQIVSALRSLSHELHPATLDIVGLAFIIPGP